MPAFERNKWISGSFFYLILHYALAFMVLNTDQSKIALSKVTKMVGSISAYCAKG